jgi:hypothetical protein
VVFYHHVRSHIVECLWEPLLGLFHRRFPSGSAAYDRDKSEKQKIGIDEVRMKVLFFHLQPEREECHNSWKKCSSTKAKEMIEKKIRALSSFLLDQSLYKDWTEIELLVSSFGLFGPLKSWLSEKFFLVFTVEPGRLGQFLGNWNGWFYDYSWKWHILHICTWKGSFNVLLLIWPTVVLLLLATWLSSVEVTINAYIYVSVISDF